MAQIASWSIEITSLWSSTLTLAGNIIYFHVHQYYAAAVLSLYYQAWSRGRHMYKSTGYLNCSWWLASGHPWTSTFRDNLFKILGYLGETFVLLHDCSIFIFPLQYWWTTWSVCKSLITWDSINQCIAIGNISNNFPSYIWLGNFIMYAHWRDLI